MTNLKDQLALHKDTGVGTQARFETSRSEAHRRLK